MDAEAIADAGLKYFLEERILDVIREKRYPLTTLEKAEKEAGIASGTKPTVEQLQAVLTALENM